MRRREITIGEWYVAIGARTIGRRLRASLAIATLLLGPGAARDDRPFTVVEIRPGNKTADVELEPLIQIHVSEPFDPATADERAIRLVALRGGPVVVRVRGDLGGVITVSVDEPLGRAAEYELCVADPLRSRTGKPVRPIAIRFRTTDRAPAPPRPDLDDFRFTRTRLDRRDGVIGLALAGPRLFACTWDGRLIRYDLADDGGLAGGPAVILEAPRRFNAIAVDPATTADRIVLWLSHDSQHRLSVGPNDFSGTLSRLTIRGDAVEVDDLLVGLPTGDHPASGLTFGPDGRLYVSQGALSMLGGKPEVPETPLSAATLAIDLRHELWTTGRPIDVRNDGPATKPAAIEVYATGIREAFDLCWHSGGGLYAGVNMNDTGDSTPDRPGLPAVNVRPAEMMIKIERGKYYGHPNPSRGEWVLLGGNPSAGPDPWEVPQLPVGTRPQPNFDPRLLIRDLEADKGPSADGVCEWTADGPLKGRLIFCFYTATRGLHTYRVARDGRAVDDPQPLVGSDDRLLRFGAPLDVVHDPRGRLYVADFSAPERGDSGMAGGVWLVRPVGRPGATVPHQPAEPGPR